LKWSGISKKSEKEKKQLGVTDKHLAARSNSIISGGTADGGGVLY